ncbi:MAG: deoxyribodipyrimidine photolyase [Alphaproteobacteria bacterium]|nr:deoxyribodipyrimidine photolyase [Alphaproteobacteria bacterium]MCB9796771.1 deoxyribodipyrimidine photolyase [Alphaproteobacteria bacterium]
MLPDVPALRVLRVNGAPLREGGAHVLYWMIAARRPHDNFGLQRALRHAQALGRPLMVLEALRCDYRWASERLHRFVIDGMADNARAFADTPVAYHPYVEPARGAGKGLLAALAQDACVVVTDHFPCFFLPRMVEAAGAALDVRLEAVDGNGLYPLEHADREFTVAHSLRRHLQKQLRPHLAAFPVAAPLAGLSLPPARVPEAVAARWPAASQTLLSGQASLETLPIDHAVRPTGLRGGHRAAEQRAAAFLDDKLRRYDVDRNDPDSRGASGLSPYLHFGHLSPHTLVRQVFEAEDWSPERLAPKPNGKRHGWWGLSEPAEAFLDELITWRELGYVYCHQHPEVYGRYESLPGWAQETLAEHADDERPWRYDLETLDAAATHDPIWNAAQRQLKAEGRIHNYLRMLWGKKVLHWTSSPQEAWDILVELNNRYALDGRNPNSYSGISWTFGRFDRAWGPERPVFGKIRYMSSDSTRKKLSMDQYLARWGKQRGLFA